MTVQQLKCFSVMAELLHYTKAANQLYISQPSLSYSISELEKELGVPLFERRENKTSLTHYGETLLPHVREALDRLDAITLKAYELRDPSCGTINLGIIYSVSFDFVPKLLEEFYSNREHGNITVSCVQGDNQTLIDRLAEDKLDLIISGKTPMKDFDRTYLYTQELKLVVPAEHRLAERTAVRLKDLENEGLISLGPRSNISGHIAKCFQERGLEAKFVLNVAECSAMGAFISSNMGIAIAPIVPSFHSNTVRIIPFVPEDRALLGRKIYLQWRKDCYLPPVVLRLRDFIISEFALKEKILEA